MSQTYRPHGGTNVLIEVPGIGVVLASGPTVPTDADKGYAAWCKFHHTDAATLDDSWYINAGDIDSCNFDALDLTLA